MKKHLSLLIYLPLLTVIPHTTPLHSDTGTATVKRNKPFTAQSLYNNYFHKNYLAITEYQKTLSDMMAGFVTSYLYKNGNVSTKKKNHTTDNSLPIITQVEEIPQLSREEALEKMKLITARIFDVNDTDYLSAHLMAMKALAPHLDESIDKKTIDAIHFLLENQHRSSMVDSIFWIKAMKEKDLKNSIPMTEEVAAKLGFDSIKTLRSKMNTQPKDTKIQNKEDISALQTEKTEI